MNLFHQTTHQRTCSFCSLISSRGGNRNRSSQLRKELRIEEMDKHRTFAITTQSVSIDVLFQNKEKDKEVSLMQIRDSSRQN